MVKDTCYGVRNKYSEAELLKGHFHVLDFSSLEYESHIHRYIGVLIVVLGLVYWSHISAFQNEV